MKAIYADSLRLVLDAWGKYKRYEPAVSAIRLAIADLPPAVVHVIALTSYWEPDPAAGWLCVRCGKWHVEREKYCCGCGSRMEGKQ